MGFQEERLGTFVHLWPSPWTFGPLLLAPYFFHVLGFLGVWDTQLADANCEGQIFLGPWEGSYFGSMPTALGL